MKIWCDRHNGYHIGLSCSPDLMPYAKKGQEAPDAIIEIKYVYKGDVTHIFLISPAFAEEHGVEETGEVPLPHDYPSWMFALTGLCGLCASELKCRTDKALSQDLSG